MSEYSVEEVRARFEAPEVLAAAHKMRVASLDALEVERMLHAYAERIKADEGAVPVVRRLLAPDGRPYGNWDSLCKAPMPEEMAREGWSYQVAYDRPPVQAAQVFALPQSFVDRATSSDESEPPVMGAGHLAQFTTAQVDWQRKLAPPTTRRVGMTMTLLSSYLDAGGWHTEAENVRNGIDLESYENELSLIDWLLRHARLTQPAQSVDVEKARDVIAELRCTSHVSTQRATESCEEWADKLTAALQEKGNG